MEVFLGIDEIPNHKDLITPKKLAPYIRKYGKLVRFEDQIIK